VGPEDLLGDAGLMKELKIKIMERMALLAHIDEWLITHIGRVDAVKGLCAS